MTSARDLAYSHSLAYPHTYSLYRAKVEPNFTSLVMAIVVLEGLGRQLDPSLDLFSVALPILYDLGPDLLFS